MALFVGLTGGIGSGKTTVCAMLAYRGAVIVDADEIVHEIQRPGTDAFDEIVETFGPDVVGEDGSLDRKRIAAVVFGEPERLHQLEAITHPRVGARIAERVEDLRTTDSIVILDIPLLGASKSGSERFADAVIVVTASEPTRMERLVSRGMSEEDARSRIRAQITDSERLKMADHVLSNEGDISKLEAQVDELWNRLLADAKDKAGT